MQNLFRSMFEAEGDAPEIEEPAPAPEVEESPMDNTPDAGEPPTIDDASSYADDGGGMDSNEYADGNQQSSGEDDTTLDEKGEIFAKVKILKEYRSLYTKIDDTLSMIDKIDLVQIGNNIKSKDIGDIKDKLSELMNDVYTTIVYEFQLQYKNLKVKMVGYSSRYIILVKSLVSLIKKDQK